MKTTTHVMVSITYFIFKALPPKLFLVYHALKNFQLTCDLFLLHARICHQSTSVPIHRGGSLCFSQDSTISFTHLDTSSYRSCPVVPWIERNVKSSSVILRLESTPQMKIDSQAILDVSCDLFYHNKTRLVIWLL